MDPVGSDELRQLNYEIAQAIAPTWKKRRSDIEAFAAPVREWLVRELDPKPGDTIVELAAGNGDTGFEVASRVGAKGTLLTTDFSPAMLASARDRAGVLGIDNAEFLVLDAERMQLDDDSVDGVICRYAFMLMIDPLAALTETHRVLRAGGRLVFAVWGPPLRNPFFTAAVAPLVAAGHLQAPDPNGPGVFRLADPTRLSALLGDAGFEEWRFDEVAVQCTVRDVNAYLDLVADTAGPIGLTIQGLSSNARAALAAAARDRLETFTHPDGLDIPGVALCANAHVRA